jgi:type II secretory pathway pseudopilin PulG
MHTGEHGRSERGVLIPMRWARRAVAALRREQDGMTLVELLVAASLGLVVVGAGMSIFVSSIRSEPRTASKVDAIQQARVTADRITRELRQGLEVKPASPSQLEIVTYVKTTGCSGAPASTSMPCEVTYACSSGACTRTVAEPDGTEPGPTVQVVSGLASADVFDPQPTGDPSYVGVTFSLVAEGDPVVVEDGVALRNPSEEP